MSVRVNGYIQVRVYRNRGRLFCRIMVLLDSNLLSCILYSGSWCASSMWSVI